MNEKVMVVTRTESKVDLKYLSTFFSVTEIDEKQVLEQDLQSFDLVIIDSNKVETLITVANKIREKVPNMSLLMIASSGVIDRKEIITQINGYGQMRILYQNSNYPEKIIDFSNSLIHPEYVISSSDVALIIPVYNEEARFLNVLNFYKKIEVLTQSSFINLTVYFVNDGSNDRTQELIDKIAEDKAASTDMISNVSFVNTKRLDINTHKAGTYIEGIKSISSDILVFVDADDSFGIEEIAKMINIIRDGYYDIVVGTKDHSSENRPFYRKVMSFFKRQLTQFMLPEGVSDSQTGLKAITGECARMILPHLHTDTELAIDLELLHIAKKLRFRTLQIKVKCIDREGSHISVVRDSIQFLKSIVFIKKYHKKLDFYHTNEK